MDNSNSAAEIPPLMTDPTNKTVITSWS